MQGSGVSRFFSVFAWALQLFNFEYTEYGHMQSIKLESLIHFMQCFAITIAVVISFQLRTMYTSTESLSGVPVVFFICVTLSEILHASTARFFFLLTSAFHSSLAKNMGIILYIFYSCRLFIFCSLLSGFCNHFSTVPESMANSHVRGNFTFWACVRARAFACWSD